LWQMKLIYFKPTDPVYDRIVSKRIIDRLVSDKSFIMVFETVLKMVNSKIPNDMNILINICLLLDIH
jgi:hypothetical protein